MSVGTAQIRNVVLMSHGGAGKTSLVEALAFTAGAINRQGRVEDGTTVADFDPDEQKRGMSRSTAVVAIDLGAGEDATRINLIDTPGYADFVGELIAGAAAADTALILVDAAAGPQVGTDTAWRIAEERGMPRAIVVSRLDRENARWDETVAAIQAQLGPQCHPVQLPIGLESAFGGVERALHLGAVARAGVYDRVVVSLRLGAELSRQRLAVQRNRVQPRQPERRAGLRPEARASLPVRVHQQYPAAHGGAHACEVGRQRGLSRSALLGDQRDDHAVPRRSSVSWRDALL